MRADQVERNICIQDYNTYTFYSTSAEWYEDLILDIQKAVSFIYIETFRMMNDIIGEKICNALIEKVKQGIRVRLLVDWWGTRTSNVHIKNLSEAGGEVRYFQKFVFSIALFSRNHMRDHRKIVVIDNEIAYIGSANFSHYSTQWRESILRVKGNVAAILKKIFMDNYKIYNKDIFHPWVKKAFKRTILFDNFYFIREVPSVLSQRIKKNYVLLIQRAKKSIIIETPYFIPGYRIYKELINAAKRGVNVKIIVPKSSDLKTIDYLRDAIWDKLYKKGIHIFFYTKSNLHSKLMLIDNKTFSIGSANFDHRSFKYMFEIAMISDNINVKTLIKNHIDETLNNTIAFDLNEWKKRPFLKRILALLFMPIRHLL
ncbi:MAG: phosphatidylserine/phosphatidylglycerophosphate/cardiolipin synthase family protein [Bacteroidales bacterium]|jgi:cardiolipin synthase|nr:phosphatidylserine/phosphatidylglycerophosphate/cardiolipin synthase family protein [Bacteroidales bacterium]MDD2687973.1 phosphatidylserine/phosphatidylglycerophosphate/cardiolipin synthase family protein [Bacteroidales bacterium]MDD3690579.1 phosphatidylserine/phosphatidylglycerophosphate/cardiolipin synthase family protein [Bacteroidales bacterium]MDD4044055.1 phosphatidylserine/phosphatidylglycerophosphate/cardiolipin synthase family protein [Bacteroidales bacterium]NLO42633.1 phosphatid